MTIRDTAVKGLPLQIPVIDAHTHIGPQYSAGWHQKPEYAAVEGHLALYDRLGVDCCVTAPHLCSTGVMEETNRAAKAAADRFPGRVYGYIFISPWEGLDGCRRELERYREDPDFIGLKFLGGYNRDYDDPVYQYAADFANEMRCPVLCHTWENSPPLAKTADLAGRRPGLKLLVAHQGGGTAEMTRQCAALMRELPNVWMELCGSLNNTLGVAEMAELTGEDRLVFGSDMTDLDVRYDFGRVALSPLPDEVKKKIFADNYLGLLETSYMGKIRLPFSDAQEGRKR